MRTLAALDQLPVLEFAAELRLRPAKFGATPEDRMRLRLTVQTPGEQPREQATGPSELRPPRGAGTCTSLADPKRGR